MTIETLDRASQYGLRVPPNWLKYLEFRFPLEALAAVAASPWLLTQPRGRGQRVLVIPGFAFTDRATWPLRQYLRLMGYRALPWGRGKNRGRPEHDAKQIVTTLREDANPAPLSIIGWSLGGVIARLVAREAPERVRSVITLGTPVEGGPKYTAVGGIFAKKRGIDLDEFEHHAHSINSDGIRPPLTVIFSRTDGVVGWRAAIDRYNPHANHVAVPSSHVGLGAHPLVWRAVVRALNH